MASSNLPNAAPRRPQPAVTLAPRALSIAALLASGCGPSTPLPPNVGSSDRRFDPPSTNAAPSIPPADAERPEPCPEGQVPTAQGCVPVTGPAAPCPSGQVRTEQGCQLWPLAEQLGPLEHGCPPGMRLLPPRSIAAWTATTQEKRLFGLDCQARPESCHQAAQVLGPFCIDVTEVTAAEYARCVEADRCSDAHLDCGPAASYGREPQAELPINCVDHRQATTYCEALGKRLPLPEEYGWAQSSGAYDAEGHLVPPWGGRYPQEMEIWASIGPIPLEGPGPVTARPKSNTRQGVADLFGNVREWSAPYRGTDGTTRIARLGYSYQTTRKTPIGAGTKTPAAPEAYDEATGFRCVATPVPPR